MSDKNFKVKNGLDANGAVTITQPTTSTVPLTILANTLATGSNLLEVKRPDGTVRLSIGNDGSFSAQNLVAYNVRFYSAQTVAQGLIIRGLPSQTANLQEWRDINEAVLASVSASGSISAVDLTLSGNLTVNGTTTNLNSTNLVIEDKNIIIADVATPTDTTADGAGITIKGATDKTLNWVQSTGYFTSSEPFIINTTSTTRPSLIVKAIASQTSAVQEWQNSSGLSLANIDSSGYFRGPLVEARPTNPGLYGIAIAANVSQSGDLFQITDASNNAYTGVSSTGKLVTGNTTNASRFTQLTSAALGQLTIYAPTASTIGTVIRGASSQTANLQEWQNNNGQVRAKIDSYGGFSSLAITTITNDLNGNGTALVVQTKDAGGIPIAVKGFTSQTADLQQWQNSAGAALAKVDASGNIIGSNLYYTYTLPDTPNAGVNWMLLGTWSTIQNGSALKISIDGKTGYNAQKEQLWNSELYFVTSNDGSTTTALDSNGFYGNGLAYRNMDLGSNISNTDPRFRVLQNSKTSYSIYIKAYQWLGSSAYKVSFSQGTSWLNSSTRYGDTAPTGTVIEIVPTPSLSSNGGTGIIVDTTTKIGLFIKGAPSQTANLQEWQNSSGSVLASVTNGGRINASTFNGAQVGNSFPGIVIDTQEADTTQVQLRNLSSTIKSGKFVGTKGRPGYADAVAGDDLVSLIGQQYVSSANSDSGRILISNDDSTPSATSYPTRITFHTTAINSTTLTERMRINNAGNVLVNGFTASTVGLILKGAASQTANLQEWQNSAGTVLTRIGSDGAIYRGATTIDSYGAIYTTETMAIGANANQRFATGGMTIINRETASAIIFGIKGLASQSGDLTQWRNSSDTVLAKVDSAGNITATSYNLSNSLYSVRKTIKKTVDPAQNAVANNTYDLFDMNFPSSLQGTFYIQASIRGGGYGQNLTYSLPATYAMDWINQYPITNPFTNSTTWVDLTPLTFSPRHLMTNDYFKFQAKVNANQISFRIKLTGTLTGAPVFDIYIQHSEEFANSTITELNTTGTDATTSNVMPNFLSSKAGLSAIFNPITLYSNNSTNIPLSVRGAASQSVDLQQWYDGSGSMIAAITSTGGLGIGTSTLGNNSKLTVSNGGIKIASGGTAALDASLHVSTSYGGFDRLTQMHPSAASKPALNLMGATGSNGSVAQWYSWGVDTDLNWKINTGTLFSTPNLAVLSNGTVALNTTTSLAQLGIVNSSSSTIGLVIRGAASQSATLQEWQNNSGTVLAKVDASGNFSAITKSFDIPHPTKENMRLRYASLEGPENGVYVRGTAESNIIELPDYWTGLVHEDSITVSLTAVGSAQNIYVEKIENNKVYIGGEFTKAFFTVYGERKDIDNLIVEY